MGQPAARMTDPTAHGGMITLGFPMVLIGGMPAARMGDMHVCPMLTPGVPPIPHVGGPIILGSPMVLIGGQPAARMGDMLTCVGPPDSIIMGCPTVLIGGGGSGSASGGGASGGASKGGDASATQALSAEVDSAKKAITEIVNSAKEVTNTVIDTMISAAASAVAGAATAFSDNTESSTKEGFWVEYEFQDSAGNPVAGVAYDLTHPDSKHSAGSISSDGKIKRDAQQPGQSSVKLTNLNNAKWSKEIAKPGEKIKLSAAADGIKEGEPAIINIYRKDISGIEIKVKTSEAAVKSNKVEIEIENDLYDESDTSSKYTSAGYYFEVLSAGMKAVSDLLFIEDTLEIEFKDSDGNALSNAEYVLFLPNGKVESGNLDSNGYKKIDKIPAGKYSIRLPGLASSSEPNP